MYSQCNYGPDWKAIYKRKLVSGQEAVSYVRSGDLVLSAGEGGESDYLLNLLAQRKDELQDVSIHCCNSRNVIDVNNPECSGHFLCDNWFVGPVSRTALHAGQATFTPSHFSQYEENISRSKWGQAEIGILQVSPPDNHGFMSFGITTAYSRGILERAQKILVQVNPKMPRVLGDNFMHVSEADYIVEAESELWQFPDVPPTEIQKAIAAHIAERIEDGSTLQLGIGGIPNAVGALLAHKKHLGVHTEMITQCMRELVECGAVDNSMKKIHRGKLIGTFAGGNDDLYGWMDNNPLVECYPVKYVNNPAVIAQNDKLVSINATIEVDLTGQACSESIGARQYSGIGGQMDYVRGAYLSKGGKSFLAVSSTAETRQGRVSCIVPMLKHGAVVSTARTDIDMVVTEYGVAELRGRSIRERVRNLVAIAHPDFREGLLDFAKKSNYI